MKAKEEPKYNCFLAQLVFEGREKNILVKCGSESRVRGLVNIQLKGERALNIIISKISNEELYLYEVLPTIIVGIEGVNERPLKPLRQFKMFEGQEKNLIINGDEVAFKVVKVNYDSLNIIASYGRFNMTIQKSEWKCKYEIEYQPVERLVSKKRK